MNEVFSGMSCNRHGDENANNHIAITIHACPAFTCVTLLVSD
jgi:hypothetical protein